VRPPRLLYLVRHGEQENAEVESETAGLSSLGRWQAAALGERLRGTPLAAIHHSPIRRAAETAEILAGYLPNAPLRPSKIVGDYVPSTPADLPPVYAQFLSGVSDDERAEGARLAAAALARFGGPQGESELIVTHTFLIGWFVREVMGGPSWRWLGLNSANCGLTVLAYRDDRPPTVLSFNDMGHLLTLG
jgi:broad specificity phosphatase PhoE